MQDQVGSDDERGAGRLLRQMLSSGSDENAILHSICYTEGRLIPTHAQSIFKLFCIIIIMVKLIYNKEDMAFYESKSKQDAKTIEKCKKFIDNLKPPSYEIMNRPYDI